jgi:hypothetical protein
MRSITATQIFSLSPGKLSVFSCRLFFDNPSLIGSFSRFELGLFVIHEDSEIRKDCAAIDPESASIGELRGDFASRMSSNVGRKSGGNYVSDLTTVQLFAGMTKDLVENDFLNLLVLSMRQAGESASHVCTVR